MKFILSIIIFVFSIQLSAQNLPKNNIYSSYSFVIGNRYSGGNMIGNGYTVGYSRYLINKFYGDFSFGKLDYRGQNSSIFLPKEETGRFDMSFQALGFGYDLIQRPRFILSSEAVFLRITNSLLQNQIGGGENIIVRETGRSSDITARIGLKARYFLTDNLQLIPSVAYGFQIQSYETNWLNIGVGYSF